MQANNQACKGPCCLLVRFFFALCSPNVKAVPKKTLSEDEKVVLRGKAAVMAWEDEVIEMEISSGKMYFPLNRVNV